MRRRKELKTKSIMVSFNLETLEIETNETLSVCNRANDPENPSKAGNR